MKLRRWLRRINNLAGFVVSQWKNAAQDRNAQGRDRADSTAQALRQPSPSDRLRCSFMHGFLQKRLFRRRVTIPAAENAASLKHEGRGLELVSSEPLAVI